MSIGKNTRKPVAAASAMPRTIDNAKSDMEALAYNNSAIAGLALAEIFFRPVNSRDHHPHIRFTPLPKGNGDQNV